MTASGGAGRSRYIDTLRAVAILRVYLLHTLWWGWLPAVFPAMSVMFALAGYLTAISLTRRGPVRTVGSRLRRLLPPLWALGLVAVPLMLLHGWRDESGFPGLLGLANWVVPLVNPPASVWGGPFALALWYLRAYLWLVLLSPVLWWAFRRWPVPTLLVLLTAAVVCCSPLVDLPVNSVGDGLWSTVSYGTCWLLGYARHTGLLERLSWPVLGALASAAAAGSMAWNAWGTPGSRSDGLAEMLWGIAFVLIVMRARPNLAWLDRLPRLAAAITAVNARAVTIYVWHLPAAYAAGALLALAGVDQGRLSTLGTTTLLLAMIVLVLGWVEDLAARRRPSLLPPTHPAGAARRGQPGRRDDQEDRTGQAASTESSTVTARTGRCVVFPGAGMSAGVAAAGRAMPGASTSR